MVKKEQYGPLRLDKDLMDDIRQEASDRNIDIADVVRERLAVHLWKDRKEVSQDGTEPGSA